MKLYQNQFISLFLTVIIRTQKFDRNLKSLFVFHFVILFVLFVRTSSLL